MFNLGKVSLILFLIFPKASFAENDFPLIWNVESPNKYWVGREKEIDFLEKNLLKKNYQIFAIVGTDGIGKSQLAKKYANDYKKYYDLVWWFNSSQNIDHQIKDLAIEVSKLTNSADFISPDKQMVLHKLKEFFRKTNLRWLLVFDNYDNKIQIRNYVPIAHNPKSYGSVLVTSRNNLTWDNILKLEKLSRIQSIKLLNNIINTEDERLNTLAELLDDYPIALVQAASYIAATPSVNLGDYIQLFSESRQQLWKRQNKMAEDLEEASTKNEYENSVFSTLDITMNKIKRDIPIASEFANLLSFLCNNRIPEFYLKDLATKGLHISEEDFHRVITELAKYSLIEREQEKLYNTSKIVQTIIRDHIDDKKSKYYLNKLAELILTYIPSDINITATFLLDHDYMVNHIEKLLELAKFYKLHSEDIINLKLRLAEYYLFAVVDYEQTNKIIHDIQEEQKLTNLQKYYFNMLLAVYESWSNSNNKKALEYGLIAEKFIEPFNEKEYEKIWLFNQMAQFNIYFGRVSEARIYLDKSSQMLKLYPNSSGNILYEWLLGKVEMDSGNYEPAYEHYIKSNDNFDNKEEDNNAPGLVESYLLKYRILIKLGRSSEIYHSVKTLILKLDKIYGSRDHTTKYYSYAIFADTAIKLGKLKEAKDALDKAESIILRLCGNNSTDQEQAYFYMVKGDYFHSTGKMEEAFNCYSRSEEIYDKIFPIKETDDVSEVISKLAIISSKLLDSATASFYLDLHVKHYGYNHPRTKDITSYFVGKEMNIEF